MSGDGERRSSAPQNFTEAEAHELAGNRGRPVLAIARLRKAVPSGALGKLDTDLPTPPRVSREELVMMRRETRRSEKVLSLFSSSEAPAERYEKSKLGRSPLPEKRPPTKD